ncbi:MAG: SPOR domain-containing protein, partial [Thermodesulfovibrionales bacterium]
LLNRTSVIVGAIIISVISLALGYFIGFKTGTSGSLEVEHITEKPPKRITNDEKRVLEPPPPPSPTPQTNKVVPSDIDDVKQTDKPVEKKEVEKKTEEPKIIIQEQKQDLSSPRGFEKRLTPEKRQDLEQDQTKSAPKVDEKRIEKQTSTKVKNYTIQLGAFPSRSGAEELKTQLKGKGINAYIVNKDKDSIYFKVRVGSYSNKKEAERALISIEKQTGLKGFITVR